MKTSRMNRSRKVIATGGSASSNGAAFACDANEAQIVCGSNLQTSALNTASCPALQGAGSGLCPGMCAASGAKRRFVPGVRLFSILPFLQAIFLFGSRN